MLTSSSGASNTLYAAGEIVRYALVCSVRHCTVSSEKLTGLNFGASVVSPSGTRVRAVEGDVGLDGEEEKYEKILDRGRVNPLR